MTRLTSLSIAFAVSMSLAAAVGYASGQEIVITPEEWGAVSEPPPPGPEYKHIEPAEEKSGPSQPAEQEKPAETGKPRPLEVTDENFMAEINKSKKPVMLVFWQVSCTDCNRMKGTVDSIAAEGRVKVLTLNVQHNQAVPEHFDVTDLPAFFLVRGGSVVKSATGAMSKDKLKNDLGIK